MKKRKPKYLQSERKSKNKGLSIGLSIAMLMTSVLSPAVAMAGTETYSKVSAVEHFGGIDRYETAAKVAQEGWKGTSESAILAGGNDDNLVDALAAAPLAKLKKAPILLTDSGSDSLNPFAAAELRRLGTKTLYVVSGEGVIKEAVLDELAAMGIQVIKLGGRDRWETAVNIAKHMGNFNQVVVATGWVYADAASMASIAAAKGMPILLTDTNALPQGVADYLGEIKDQLTQTYVIGGEGIISNPVMNSFPNPKRIAGLDRYETNMKLLQYFANDLGYVKTYVAKGGDNSLVDALVGSSLASLSDAPILLIGDEISDATRDFAEKNLSPHIIALGGEGVLSSLMVSKLAASLDVTQDGAIVGSSDTTQLQQFDETLKIAGDEVTLQNAVLDHSVYISGDQVSLENVTVKGTVFLDPGEEGNANLDHVKAGKIVVLSGAKESIHIKDSEAGTLVVSSTNEVRVESSGTTKVGNTVVRSYAILDAAGGTLGRVEVASTDGQAPVVTLKGTFDQPIVVSGAATLKADPHASIAKVEVAPESMAQKVTLEGSFMTVEVNKEADLNLGATAVVQNLVSYVNTDLTVENGAKVEKFDDGGFNVNLKGDGAENIPPSGQTTQPPSNSGGSGNNEQANASIAAAKALLPATITPDADTDTNLLTLLNDIEGMGATGVTLSITSSTNANVANEGLLTFGKNEVTGNVVISMAKAGGTTDSKTVSVVVPGMGDAQAVALAEEALSFELIKGLNDAVDHLTKTMNLIADDRSFTDNGVSIRWETTNIALNPQSGEVTRPAWDELNASGTLTAVLSKNGITVRKEFEVTVLKIDPAAYEENNTMEKATLITSEGVAQTHVITPEEDEDWIKFEAEEGALYTIRTSNLLPEYNQDLMMDTEITLYDAAGVVLQSNDDDDYGFGLWSRLDWVAPGAGTYYIKVTNYGGQIGQYDILVNKVSSPSILYVSADSYNYNGLYKTGDQLEFYVIFSEKVKVTGNPRLKLATGADADRLATYVSGSDTNVLTFGYTVQEGDLTKHLETFGASLDLDGGSIKTYDGVLDVNVALPEQGNVNSLGVNTSIALNTVLPEYIYNDGVNSIFITLNGLLAENSDFTGLEKAFSVTDLEGNSYEVTAVTAVSTGEAQNEIVLTVNNFSESAGKLWVNYAAAEGGLVDEFGNTIEDFEIKFTPDLTITPLDLTPPVFAENYPTAQWDMTTEMGVELAVLTDEVGKGYYVVLSNDAAAPSPEQIKAGTDAYDIALTEGLKGELLITENLGGIEEAITTISGLEASTAYDIYVVVEDNAGNLQTVPGKAEVTTLSTAEVAIVPEIMELGVYYENDEAISSDEADGAYAQYQIILGMVNALPDSEFKSEVLFELKFVASQLIDAFIAKLENYAAEGVTPEEFALASNDYSTALDLVVDLALEDENQKQEVLGKINTAWAPIAESKIPTILVTGVSFAGDTDTDYAQIAGSLTWTPVSADADVEGYRIYFVDDQGKQLGEAIGVVADKTAAEFTIPDNTEVPGSTASFGVYSNNQYGESQTGALRAYDYAVDDIDVAGDSPNNVIVTVTTGSAITVEWTPAVWPSADRQLIYILPQGTSLNGENAEDQRTSLVEIPNNTTNSWSGDLSQLATDSQGNPFVAGAYTAYVVAATDYDENYFYWRWNSSGADFNIAAMSK